MKLLNIYQRTSLNSFTSKLSLNYLSVVNPLKYPRVNQWNCQRRNITFQFQKNRNSLQFQVLCTEPDAIKFQRLSDIALDTSSLTRQLSDEDRVLKNIVSGISHGVHESDGASAMDQLSEMNGEDLDFDMQKVIEKDIDIVYDILDRCSEKAIEKSPKTTQGPVHEPKMTKFIVMLVYRLNLLGMLMTLMRSAKNPTIDSKIKYIKSSKRILGMKDLCSPANFLSEVELKTFEKLKAMRMNIESFDLKTAPFNSSYIAKIISKTPLREGFYLPSWNGSMRPSFREFTSDKLNYALRNVVKPRSAKHPSSLFTIGKILMHSKQIPCQKTFDILIRRFVITQNLGVAALIILELMLECTMDSAGPTIAKSMSTAAELNDLDLAESIVDLLVTGSRDTLTDSDYMKSLFGNRDLVTSIISASIKLKKPDIYLKFRDEYIRKRCFPSGEILAKELRFAYFTGNSRLAEDTWNMVIWCDENSIAPITVHSCIWMAMHAERTENADILKQVIDAATKRNLLDKLKSKLIG
ncbi:hypothetical protein V1511DRAFT_492048 [Dipodascopsis uninucleata]